VRLAIVMAATVAGAALFAALHPAPRDAYEAAATLVIPVRGSATAEVAPRTLQAAELVRQPSVVGQALERALQGSEPGKVLRGMEVEPRPAAGIVRFSVRAATADNATRLAEELARVTVETLQRGRSTGERFGLRILGDFETGNDGWASTGTGDGLAAVGLVPGGRYGGSALRALCDVTAGCGAARVIEGRFLQGQPVTLTAWVRGRQPSRVLLALGSARSKDRATTTASVDREWKRLELRWIPARDERRIAVAVNNAGPGLSDVDIDGVLLLADGDRLSDAQERRLFAERGYAYATPARIVGSRTGRTLRWAAIGAAAGLAVGLAAVGAWTFALRRRERLTAPT
jgi:hypothetical protein